MIEVLRIQEELDRAAESPEHQADMEILADMWAQPAEALDAARERIDARRLAACEAAGRRYQEALDRWRMKWI